MSINQTVSTIIATYNRPDFIIRACESVLEQKRINVELIIVDDYSQQDYTDKINHLKSRYSQIPIKYIKNDVNLGYAASVNIGFKESTGNYVAFLGDDDFWTDEFKLYKQYMLICEDKKTFSTTDWYEFNEKNKIQKSGLEKIRKLKQNILVGNGFLCGSTPLIHSCHFQAYGFDEKIKKGIDSDFFRRSILSGYKIAYLNECTTAVDVGGHVRMTPEDSFKSSRIQLWSYTYTYFKYWNHYLVNFYALVHRTYNYLRIIKNLLFNLFKRK